MFLPYHNIYFGQIFSSKGPTIHKGKKMTKNYALQCINLNRKMPISIRYGKNAKIAKCLSQLGMEKM